MATNNVKIKNAALAGACVGLLIGRDGATAGASTSLDDIAAAIATEVDSKILADETMSDAKANVCNQVTAALTSGRSFTSATAADYDGIATDIAAVYNSVINKLE